MRRSTTSAAVHPLSTRRPALNLKPYIWSTCVYGALRTMHDMRTTKFRLTSLACLPLLLTGCLGDAPSTSTGPLGEQTSGSSGHGQIGTSGTEADPDRIGTSGVGGGGVGGGNDSTGRGSSNTGSLEVTSHPSSSGSDPAGSSSSVADGSSTESSTGAQDETADLSCVIDEDCLPFFECVDSTCQCIPTLVLGVCMCRQEVLTPGDCGCAFDAVGDCWCGHQSQPDFVCEGVA